MDPLNITPNIRKYSITGTFHGSIAYCQSEGEARKLFHRKYNGESIIEVSYQGCKNKRVMSLF